MLAREQVLFPAIAAEVAAGLSRTPKSLPPWLFYDAEGSRLFEQITELPEYYLTRTERAILEANAGEICRRAGTNVSVVELGAGSASKTRILLRELLSRQLRVLYIPVDVSRSALEMADRVLCDELPQIQVRPIVSDYTADSLHFEFRGKKLVLYLGSSIGNFEPEEATALLARVRAGLGSGDRLLLGTDRVKTASLLVPAYDDAQGVTERFNKNILARINRELGADFDLESFRHVAIWNPPASRMEMYLESTREQAVHIPLLGMTVQLGPGEGIHTENSYKYKDECVLEMLAAAGFASEAVFSDARGWFALHLARIP